MRGMLSLLDNNRETSVDAFFVMFPAGELSGYTYNATGSLQMVWSLRNEMNFNNGAQWNQHGLTISTYDCDVNGYPLGAPIRIFTDVGAGTPQEPGNNLTLVHGIGGPSAANLNYSNPNAAGASIIRPVMGRIFKTNVAVAVNEVTKEKVIVGADMSMMFLSRQLDEIAKDISAPLFIGVIGANSGRLLASSPKMELLNEDKTRMLDARELQSPHICDFVGYLNETYGSQLGFITQMNRLADELNAMQIDGGSRFAERNVGGVDWIMNAAFMKLVFQIVFHLHPLSLLVFHLHCNLF
ncbi:hypothetical protein BCR33DRAFT_736273 [Rhizoclosmatium globosum]|uniref:Uncharacterized protein n=1 Tax=Rhizoclosmatium globosum TaxID=329046 RepID=A0A1Y2CKI8_9FUNG|nr:hypothetical protein BCR33DRAFT_736273 [Rhizoclosmatium globosum]|eukprot:ORY47477.1 hypothetical protein BCR33DRAFT_736273 [Rhizoclosmatium globosum]